MLDGSPEKNTQTARVAKVLQIMTGLSEEAMLKLEKHTKRQDGRSYISKDAGWMREPYVLGKGWYFEGCMSLSDKQKVLHALPQLGLSSREFSNCAQDFVEGKSVARYCPSDQEAALMIEKWKKQSGD
jgi:hypothetical protein